MPDMFTWLDKRASDILIADDTKLKRNAALDGKAQCRGQARIRDGNDKIGVDRRLDRQFPADPLPRLINRRPLHQRTGPREINILEHAEPFRLPSERTNAVHTLIV